VPYSIKFSQTHFAEKTYLLRELRVHIKRIRAPIIAGLLLLMLILPQLTLADELIIYNVGAYSSLTSAIIHWETNLASNSTVNYGTSLPLTHTVSDSSMVTDHNIFLPDLTAGTEYYYELYSNGVRSPATPDVYWSFTTLTIGAYSIILEPACGTCGEATGGLCGQVIRVTVVVAAPGTYYICWDSLTAAGVVGTFIATTAGGRTLEFYLPEATKGNHTVYLADSTYASKASATFEVFPSVKINPEEGPVGTNVTLNGYGFTASQNIQVKFMNDKSEVIAIAGTTTAGAKGSWTASYAIPATPAGGYIFRIEAKEGTVFVGWVDKDFRVTPKITVTPGSGTVGQTVEVKGTGFQNKEKDIQITFDGEVRRKGGIAVDENGSWTAAITIPPRQSGTYKIVASGALTRARDVEGVDFILGPGILVEPSLAYVGDAITIKGGGFRPLETSIQVSFGGQIVATVATANVNGCWNTSFVLPPSPYGGNSVSARGDITAPVTNTLTVKAKIEGISPVEGAPGDSVSLTGSGFSGNKKLTVTVGGVAVTVPANMQTPSNGNVVISFRVPKGNTEGIRTLVVTDEGGATASVNFTVTKKTLSTTPLPISPEDSKLRSGIVTFNWQGVTGGTGYTYTLEISRTADSGNIWSKSGITESSYTLTDSPTVTETLPPGTYYWRVKIVDDYGNEGAWSNSIEFTVSPIPTWVWVLVGLVVLVILMVVAYRETKFKVTE